MWAENDSDAEKIEIEVRYRYRGRDDTEYFRKGRILCTVAYYIGGGWNTTEPEETQINEEKRKG